MSARNVLAGLSSSSQRSVKMPEIIDGETRLFPIIGDPIKYVKSPQKLTAGFASRGHNAICIPALVADSALADVMLAFSLMRNLDGLLITMPHKFAVAELCATTSERVKLLGAVSVIRRNADRTWHGDMLDGLAFVKAQVDRGARPEGARVLLVGAGGAGSAIALALLEAGVRELIVHDVDDQRARHLIGALESSAGGRTRLGPPDPAGCDMVCNATSAGMHEGDELPVAARLLDPTMFVGDVIAGHGVTPFVRAAREAGCRTANGDQMVEAVQEMMLDFMLD
jgi:shikimate dehydrogenase